MSLITLQNVSVSRSAKELLIDANLIIQAKERICIVGRNGVGKSTLLKLLNNEFEPESGQVKRQQNLITARLEQDLPAETKGSIYTVIAQGLGERGELLAKYHAVSSQLAENPELADELNDLQQELDNQHAWELTHEIERVITKLGLNAEQEFLELSGGLKRRVLLGRALVNNPDVLFLDEPTNHLDIDSINWLENFINEFSGTIIFITHDRTFLQKLATRIIEIDRGQLTSFPGNYTKYLETKEHLLEVEAAQNKNFDKKLAEEEAWIRQGIKARRTRNEGRVRALHKLREQRKARQEVTGKANMQLQQAERSGKIVVEAKNINFNYPDKQIINDFSITIMRGDKIGLIGPNGVGKTTLLKLLLGELQPQSGSIKHGSKLEIAYFDQLRANLDEEKSVAENVSYGDEFVTIGEKSVHIMGYLQNFLFSSERARTPVKLLSGGERNRLLLARLFTKPANVYVMDEPTNDLDLETLELLEEMLFDYSGTLLLVSHDRSFLDNVVTSTIAFAGDGRVEQFVGGYTDWLRQRTQAQTIVSKKSEKPKAKPELNYKALQKQLRSVEQKIKTLEESQQEIHAKLAENDIYSAGNEDLLAKLQTEEQANTAKLESLYFQWEQLMEDLDSLS